MSATQLKEAGRTDGLSLMADPETKPLLASFVGHLSGHVIEDIRPRLAGAPPAVLLNQTHKTETSMSEQRGKNTH